MNDKNTVLTDKIGSANTKKRKIFCCMGFFSYLCSVQWNEGLAKAPHFHILSLEQIPTTRSALEECCETYLNMIEKETIKKLVDEWLEGKDYFLVDIEIGNDNKIVVEIDHADGVWIEDCVELSKHIEDNLDRDKEDFELEVGSAGLGQPFKVLQQYVNFIGKEVEVLDAEGKKYKGVLKEVDGNTFTVTTKEKMKVEGKKRPVIADVDRNFEMDKVKYTKYIISFK